jgi:hypothetical protein
MVSALLLAGSAGVQAVDSAPLGPLEQAYLGCTEASTLRRFAHGEAAACSETAERLLQQRFGGDLDRLLAWWRNAGADGDAGGSGHGAGPAGDVCAAADARTGEARIAYENGHYARAFELFAGLADAGHAEAARITLQMHRFGPALFGQRFEASEARRARWSAARDSVLAVTCALQQR